MKLYYTPRAIADLEAIADYLQPRSPQGAASVRAAILDTLRNLVHFPHIGRRQTAETVRKIAVRKYKYLIYYTLDEAAEEIVIITIQHGAKEREFADN
jgi:plasmid stabilization system protein ParE